MKLTIATLALLLLSFISILPSSQASILNFTTSVTQTVTGYAVPTGTGLGNGLVAFILPIAITALFLMIIGGLKLAGKISSFVIKLCLFLGSLIGMIGLTAANPLNVPFGLVLVAATYLITYVWKGV